MLRHMGLGSPQGKGKETPTVTMMLLMLAHARARAWEGHAENSWLGSGMAVVVPRGRGPVGHAGSGFLA